MKIPAALLPALLIALSGITARAQIPDTCSWSPERKAVAGVVVDDSSRKPVPGLTVRLSQLPDTVSGEVAPPTRLVTASDSLGRFCFRGLRPGAYRARVLVFGGGQPPLDVRLAADDSIRHVTFNYRRRRLSADELAQRDAQLAQLAAQRRKWARARPARYRLRVNVECFCFARSGGPPPTFEVAGDSVVAVRGVPGPREGVLETWTTHTVEALFAALESQIRDDDRVVTGISYHPQYGVPTRYDTDTRHVGLTDADYNVRVEFRVVGRR